MAEPFLAEIKIFGFNFAPRGWSFCDGQILPINQNQSLYSLLGTTYGGDGRTSFALPELRGRIPLHRADTHALGQRSGEETHTLAANEMPAHTHTFKASSEPATSPNASGVNGPVLGAASTDLYRESGSSPLQPLASGSVTNAGGSQAHDNMMPYTTLSYAIAISGLFPSRS